MSESFALAHNFTLENMNPPIIVRTPIGQGQTSKLVPNSTVEVDGIIFLVSPIILKSSTIDLILGMDWLKLHDAALYCGTKSVQLFHPSDAIVNHTTHLSQDAEAQIYALNTLNASPLKESSTSPSFVNFSMSSQKNYQEYPLSEKSSFENTVDPAS